MFALLAAVVFMIACSKDPNRLVKTQGQIDVTKIAPGPMPYDTLVLDSLNHLGFQ